MPSGNPNHDPKTGEFSSGPGGGIQVASGHNAGVGSRAVVNHVVAQHAWMDEDGARVRDQEIQSHFRSLSRSGAALSGALVGSSVGAKIGLVVGGGLAVVAGGAALAAGAPVTLGTVAASVLVSTGVSIVRGVVVGGVLGGVVGLANRSSAIRSHIAAQHATDTGRS